MKYDEDKDFGTHRVVISLMQWGLLLLKLWRLEVPKKWMVSIEGRYGKLNATSLGIVGAIKMWGLPR